MYGLYNVSPYFYGNIFIITRAMGILCGETPTVYGQLLPYVKIKYEDIQITEYKL